MAGRSFFGSREAVWQFDLNPGVSFELSLKGGVENSVLDLTGIEVSKLVLSGGVGVTEIAFPDHVERVEASIEGGVGQIELNIPATVGARLIVDRGIGALSIANRFENLGGGTYETSGFDQARNSITVQIDVGVGPVIVR